MPVVVALETCFLSDKPTSKFLWGLGVASVKVKKTVIFVSCPLSSLEMFRSPSLLPSGEGDQDTLDMGMGPWRAAECVLGTGHQPAALSPGYRCGDKALKAIVPTGV